jgi:hypothetical protein
MPYFSGSLNNDLNGLKLRKTPLLQQKSGMKVLTGCWLLVAGNLKDQKSIKLPITSTKLPETSNYFGVLR